MGEVVLPLVTQSSGMLISLKSNVTVMVLVCFVFKIVQTLLSTIVKIPVLGRLISCLLSYCTLKVSSLQ